MKIAYLILAHQNPRLLKRMIGTLSSRNCAFFIHIDKKTVIREFLQIEGENIFFTEERVPVYWGEFSLVQASLLLLRQALMSPEGYDYFVLLSGSDYPLRSGAYVERFIQERNGYEFMNLVKVPAPGKPISRINTLRYPSTKPIRRFLFRGLAKLGLGRRDYRRYLGSLEPYSGIQWWALSRSACRYLLDFIDANQQLQRFFENVFAADEAFLQTILGNSAFKSRIRRNFVYLDWPTGPHPAMINEEHIRLFEAEQKICVQDVYGEGEVLFARKFSDDRLDLVDRIDAMIRRKEATTLNSTAQVQLS